MGQSWPQKHIMSSKQTCVSCTTRFAIINNDLAVVQGSNDQHISILSLIQSLRMWINKLGVNMGRTSKIIMLLCSKFYPPLTSSANWNIHRNMSVWKPPFIPFGSRLNQGQCVIPIALLTLALWALKQNPSPSLQPLALPKWSHRCNLNIHTSTNVPF